MDVVLQYNSGLFKDRIEILVIIAHSSDF